jgi:hypothetical protein
MTDTPDIVDRLTELIDPDQRRLRAQRMKSAEEMGAFLDTLLTDAKAKIIQLRRQIEVEREAAHQDQVARDAP